MKLTPEQLEALQAWRSVYGRGWKAEVRLAWETGDYHQSRHASALQQLRNELGPRWLIAYSPGDTRAGWLQPTKVEIGAGARALNFRWVSAWKIVDAEGIDMFQPYSRTKSEARCFCQNNGITLIEELK